MADPFDFQNKTVLITGAGSLGNELTGLILKSNPHAIRVLDSSEYALFRLQQRFAESKKIRYLLGDISDYDRAEFSLMGVDYVIHTAANKFVDYIEYNPFQAIKSNIDGTINVIKATLKTPTAQKFVYVSSDKACMPSSTYGLTKALAEKLVLWASKVSDKVFASIRFPNFMSSRGSVFEIWKEEVSAGKPLTITDERMKRFFIPIKDAAHLTLEALKLAKGGELFIPATAKEYKIVDLAKQIGKEIKVSGMRLGERLTEQLMTREEKAEAKRIGDLWVISR